MTYSRKMPLDDMTEAELVEHGKKMGFGNPEDWARRVIKGRTTRHDDTEGRPGARDRVRRVPGKH